MKDPETSAAEANTEALLAEYASLKAEQLSRIVQRDHLLLATITVVGAILSFALTNDTGQVTALIVPYATFSLGTHYLAVDRKITAIRRYVQNNLAPCLESTTKSSRVFEWEEVHSASRVQDRLLPAATDLLVFVLPAVAAILYAVFAAQFSVWTVVAEVCAGLLTFLLCVLIVRSHHSSVEA